MSFFVGELLRLYGCLGFKPSVSCFLFQLRVICLKVRRTAQETRWFVVKQKTIDVEVKAVCFQDRGLSVTLKQVVRIVTIVLNTSFYKFYMYSETPVV